MSLRCTVAICLVLMLAACTGGQAGANARWCRAVVDFVDRGGDPETFIERLRGFDFGGSLNDQRNRVLARVAQSDEVGAVDETLYLAELCDDVLANLDY